jgi:hypothetical protein
VKRPTSTTVDVGPDGVPVLVDQDGTPLPADFPIRSAAGGIAASLLAHVARAYEGGRVVGYNEGYTKAWAEEAARHAIERIGEMQADVDAGRIKPT